MSFDKVVQVQQQLQSASPLLSNIARRAAIRSAPDHDVPPGVHETQEPNARAFTEPHFGHDFSRVPVHAAELAATHESTPVCSFSPRRCPFGGACHTCPVQVQAKARVGQRASENG